MRRDRKESSFNSNSPFKRFILVMLCVLIILGGLIYQAFFSITNLPNGELISFTSSPNKTYSIHVYQVNGGATVSYAIRGELNFNHSRKNPKNIYWNGDIDSATVEWIDETTVKINGYIMNVLEDTYDYRR